ncbi:DUF4436 family protein [Microbacterium sp. 1P10UB]|uniref:DUF4436 family protein n=1 Tax=unclassified Microbacterium TaxID=2609290 RepID=UPI0039A19CD7
MRAGTRRRGWVVALVVLAFLGLYVGVVATYALTETQSTGSSCLPADDLPTDRITLSFTPQSVDAAGERISGSLDVLSFGPAADADERLRGPLTIYLSNVETSRTLTYEPGTIPSAQTVRLIAEGEIERWPVDVYRSPVAIIAVQNADTAEESVVPLEVCGTPHVPGWTFRSETSEATSQLFTVNGIPADEVVIIAQRSVAPVTFGVVILVLMIAMPVLCLTIALRVLRGRRKAEATLMSWMAAMLFATIPLRGFLPGSPPVGSWVDFLVVIWVLTGLVSALVIYVVAWLKWGPDGERPRGAPGAVTVPVAAAAHGGDGGSGGGAAD